MRSFYTFLPPRVGRGGDSFCQFFLFLITAFFFCLKVSQCQVVFVVLRSSSLLYFLVWHLMLMTLLNDLARRRCRPDSKHFTTCQKILLIKRSSNPFKESMQSKHSVNQESNHGVYVRPLQTTHSKRLKIGDVPAAIDTTSFHAKSSPPELLHLNLQIPPLRH